MSNIFSFQNIDKDKNCLDSDKMVEPIRNVNKNGVACLEKTSEQRVGLFPLTSISGSRRQPVSKNDKEGIIAKALEGHSVSANSSMYQINYWTVNSIIKRYL